MSEVAPSTERNSNGEAFANADEAFPAARDKQKEYGETKTVLSPEKNVSAEQSASPNPSGPGEEINAPTAQFRSSRGEQDENIQSKESSVPLRIIKQPGSPRPPSSQTSIADIEEGQKNKELNAKQPPPTPLPPDLKRILNEVALTGESSKLSWNVDEKKHASARRQQRPVAVYRPSHNRKRARTRLNHQYYPSGVGGGGSATTTATATATSTNIEVASSPRNFLNAINRSTNNRKRPLVLMKAPGSVCSGRTSGSEQEDTSQYDSEGTSVTSMSELSFDQGKHNRNLLGLPQKKDAESSKYECLRDALRSAISIVLDYFFKERGGYKMSPAEKQKAGLRQLSSAKGETGKDSPKTSKDSAEQKSADEMPKKERHKLLNGVDTNLTLSAESLEKQQQEITFQKRKKHLMAMLGHVGVDSVSKQSFSSQKTVPDFHHDFDHSMDAPPFTIQRIAEVLVAPERYYTQTHKLLNCLEKLLLVKSSTFAFGGNLGGEKTPIVSEDHERGPELDRSRRNVEIQKRRLHRLRPICLPDMQGTADVQQERPPVEATLSEMDADGSPKKKGGEPQRNGSPGPHSPTSARNILRNLDAHSRSLVESRAMTNSPPPPNLGIASASSIALPAGHLLRHNSPTSPTSPDAERRSPVARPPSPILYNSPEGSPTLAPLHSSSHNMHLLHIHHPTVPYSGSPFSLMALNHENALGIPHGFSARDLDVESRSSASSDFDSESDFDDSASDRSDGSDYEPLSAASRAMALNRMQQQHRLHSRVLSSLQSQEARPPADSEYQSGDSIDSTRAEDSGGSDSSSDLAD